MLIHTNLRSAAATALALAVALAGAAATVTDAAEVSEQRTGSVIGWQTDFQWSQAVLTVSGPAGIRTWVLAPDAALSFGIDELAAWSEATSTPLDGAYTYELIFAPRQAPKSAPRMALNMPDKNGNATAPLACWCSKAVMRCPFKTPLNT